MRLKTQAVGLRPPFVGLAGLADGVAGQILVAVLVGVVVGDLGESRQAVDNVPLEVEVGRGAAGHIVVGIVAVEPCRRDGRTVGALTGLAVFEVVAVGGGHEHAAAQNRPVVADAARRDLVAAGLRVVEGRTGRKALGDLEGGVAVERKTGEIGIDADAAVFHVAGRSGVGHLVAAAVHADVVLHPVGVVEPLALLVVILKNDDLRRIDRIDHRTPAAGHAFALLQVAGRPDRRIAVADTGRVGTREHLLSVGISGAVVQRAAHGDDIVAGVHQVEFRRGRGPCGLRLERNLGALGAVALLGGHQNHAVRRAGSVNTRRSGVLQDFDRLDVVRIESGHLAADAVHDDDRRIGLVDRRTAADQEHRIAARLVVGRRDAYARNLAFQGIADRIDRNAFQIGAAHLRNGAGQRAARLGAVTDDHHVVQHVVVLGEPHVDLRPVADRDLLRLITQIIEYQHRTRTGNDDFVIALNVGRDARLGAFDHDRRTDDRLAGAGGYPAPDGQPTTGIRLGGGVLPGQDHDAVDDLPRDAFVGEQRTENGIDSAAVHTDFHIAERHDADRRFVRKCNSGLPGHRIDRFLDGCISQGQGDIVVLCIQLFSRRQRKDVAQQQQQHTASRPKNR